MGDIQPLIDAVCEGDLSRVSALVTEFPQTISAVDAVLTTLVFNTQYCPYAGAVGLSLVV